MTCWPNPPFWHYDAERMHFHSSLFPAFSLGLVMTPLELFRLQTHELSNFVSHYWREGEHVNLNNREQIPHCPHSLLHTQQNACRPALLGANWEGQKGSSSQLHPLHTHHSAGLAGWSRAIIHTSKRCCCPWAPVSSGGSVPVLHHGSKLTGKAELLDKAGSRT